MAGMAADAHTASQFYGSARGGVACRLLRERLVQLWPDLTRQSVLGRGLRRALFAGVAGAGGAVRRGDPGPGGRGRWPPVSANLSCTVEEDALPFPDLFFDRILLVHGLEAAENARALLREVWRVLKDDGRLLVVAPNRRRALGACGEHAVRPRASPIRRARSAACLRPSLFRVERRDFALYMPPTQLRLVLRTARLWERSGALAHAAAGRVSR